MKKLILIFTLLSPTLLFSQEGNSHQTFKVGGKKVLLAVGNTTHPTKYAIKLSELLNNPSLKLIGCGDSAQVVSFDVSIGINDSMQTVHNIGMKFIPDVLVFIKQQYDRLSYQMRKRGVFLEITNVIYKKTKIGEPLTINGMILTIVE
jgi:hypothetical protein